MLMMVRSIIGRLMLVDATMGRIIAAIEGKEVDYIAFFVGEETGVANAVRKYF